MSAKINIKIKKNLHPPILKVWHFQKWSQDYKKNRISYVSPQAIFNFNFNY